MKSLVTGGSGFLGGHVIPALIERGGQVVALVRSPEAARAVEVLGATPLGGDLDDPASLDAAFSAAGADVLVNLASLGFGHAPAIVHAAEAAELTRGVFVSTTAITTNLNAPSKTVRTAAEAAIRSSSLDWTIIRPTMIYGTPKDRNLCRLIKLLRRTRLVPAPGARHLHQPVHVDDLAAAITSAVHTDASIGRSYDIGGPEAISLGQLLRETGDAVGVRARVIPVPARPLVAGLAAVERFRRLPISAEQVARLTEDKAFSIEEARRDLDFAPRAFADGIRAEAGLVVQ